MGSVYRRAGSKTYTVAWIDANGVRQSRSAKTRDKLVAEEILSNIERTEARVREGIVSPDEASRAKSDRKRALEHVEDYIAWCRHAHQAPRAVAQKERHLRAFLEAHDVRRLSEFTPERIMADLQALAAQRLSARTVNFRRQQIAAFLSWARRHGRTSIDPVRVVPRRDEERDRRRIRRALTDAEVARLLEVARERGRWLWYALALLAGLRRGDLRRLRWSDIDLGACTVTIREGKAKRVDVLPLHADLVAELRRVRPLAVGAVDSRVFAGTVTDRTRMKDFERAGLARREVVTDASGEPVWVGEGERRRMKTRLVARGLDGRYLDLHALRATLGTMLARQGVTPQVAQRLMRHSDYRTTLKHYTALTLHDSAAAIDRIELPAAAAGLATGTADDRPPTTCSASDSAKGSETVGSGRVVSETPRRSVAHGPGRKSASLAGLGGDRRVPSESGGKRAKGIEPSTFSLGS